MGRSQAVRHKTKKRGMMPIPPAIREYVLERDHHKCVICGAEAEEVHHIFSRNSWIPEYLGVPHIKKNMHPWNLVSLCKKHHRYIHDHGMRQGLKEVLVKTNKNLSYLHFNEELEKKVKKELEKLKGKV